MNLKELKFIIDFMVNGLNSYEKPEDIEVLINISEKSIGASASSKVQYAGMGIDWEHGQFRIEPCFNMIMKVIS
jgi:hypothetical protein